MDIPESDIRAIKKWAASNPLIIRAWVFGSRVKGTNRKDSDLDVAIEHGVMKGDSNAFTTAIAEKDKWKKQLEAMISLTLDLQSYLPGKTIRIESAISDASVLIYEKPSN